MQMYDDHQFPGKLFIVEGIGGSGKSTQLSLLQQWLKREGYMVVFSEWNSSPLVKETTRRGKKKQMLTPTTFSLLHTTDLADRIERHIIPPLKAGAIVLADRYIYTAFARDTARGVSPHWVRDLYRFAVKPTIAFYFRVPLAVSLKRILSARAGLKYYGEGLPGVDLRELRGRLIVIEGPDGVGRSTQVSMLKPWLESNGHAVLDTGMTRSALAGKGIKQAKAGITLGPISLTLFYATDFADRLENEMIPALRAGFIVLTDRYIYSLIARAIVRGLDASWIKACYGVALKPDAVFYLRANVGGLIPRVLSSPAGFDYWESGMDIHLGDDLFDSF